MIVIAVKNAFIHEKTLYLRGNSGAAGGGGVRLAEVPDDPAPSPASAKNPHAQGTMSAFTAARTSCQSPRCQSHMNRKHL